VIYYPVSQGWKDEKYSFDHRCLLFGGRLCDVPAHPCMPDTYGKAQEEQDAIDGSGLLYQDTEIENYLNQIAEKLQTNSISPDISFQIKVIKDPKLNAFALPNGVIYIHTGILARMDNEAQLAALLAHEMTHCTHRHSLKTLRNIKDRTQAKSATVRELART
jgi:predicted Zn-dependent protease